METETILARLVRIGTVTDIDPDARKARVRFPDDAYTSGWLYVLDTHPHCPDYDPARQETDAQSGGAGEEAFASHTHTLTIRPWMPRINDTVLTLYLPVFNGDGFVLGGIG